MAELESLVSLIYHEKQQAGSMLCAQYALNSLLQGPYFTAPDLSEIARNLDVLEEEYNTESHRGGSKNMDDTGFFSVQVLEKALQVLGLNLVRWRSSAMRPYQDHPHTQLAFILHLEQHWFTLRRFGPALPNIDEDLGGGHWFNLNSFLQAPEWVGKLYLNMVLQQAEAEGYSVFAVMQADSSAPLALPRTEADEVASTLPEPTSAGRAGVHDATRHNPVAAGPSSTATERASTSHPVEDLESIEDDDYELQIALQASLASQEGYGSHLLNSGISEAPTTPPPLVTSQTHPSVPSGPASTASSSNSSSRLVIPGHADLDPVAASMERNRVLLQRMRDQQEFAQRELWSGSGFTPEEQAAQEARQADRRRREEEQEEQLREAIAESEAMARRYEEAQAHSSSSDQPSISVDGHRTLSPISLGGFGGRLDGDYRNYDDEDAELQAALKASLENVPSGWQHRELLPPPAPRQPTILNSASADSRSTANSKTAMAAGASNTGGAHDDIMEVDDDSGSESVASDDSGLPEGTNSPTSEEPGMPPSLDEIRKARLARFGL